MGREGIRLLLFFLLQFAFFQDIVPGLFLLFFLFLIALAIVTHNRSPFEYGYYSPPVIPFSVTSYASLFCGKRNL
jgi:hypothetical protein